MESEIVFLAIGSPDNIYPRQTDLARYGSRLLVMKAILEVIDESEPQFKEVFQFQKSGNPIKLFIVTRKEGKPDFTEVVNQAIILAVNRYYPMPDHLNIIEVIFQQVAG